MPREFFYKLRREGNSRVVAVGRLLPKDWKMVQLQVLAKDKNQIDIRLIKVA